MNQWSDVLIAATITVLMLLVEHWGPWQALLRKRFHAVVNYALGVLALIVPLTVLWWRWGMWEAVASLWAVVIIGGLAVGATYLVDGWIASQLRLRAAERESMVLREELINDDPGPEKLKR